MTVSVVVTIVIDTLAASSAFTHCALLVVLNSLHAQLIQVSSPLRKMLLQDPYLRQGTRGTEISGDSPHVSLKTR
jgi:hypothetical protein